MTNIRWFTDTDEGHSQWYAEHFRELMKDGADLEGEARLVDAMVPRHAHILDAGCGQGRTSAALYRRGHVVVGVDVDDVLLDAARQDNPGPTYRHLDLADLTLERIEASAPFDACVMAGNVITFVTPNTETAVLNRLYDAVADDGFLVTGFHTERMDPDTFDGHARNARWQVESRFATWDLRPWNDAAEFAVIVLRKATPAHG